MLSIRELDDHFNEGLELLAGVRGLLARPSAETVAIVGDYRRQRASAQRALELAGVGGEAAARYSFWCVFPNLMNESTFLFEPILDRTRELHEKAKTRGYRPKSPPFED